MTSAKPPELDHFRQNVPVALLPAITRLNTSSHKKAHMTGALDKVLQRASQVKLSGGLVGRVCSVLFVACIAIGTIGALSKSEWIMGGSIVAIVVLLFPMLWKIISFAEDNPGVALLDGAQLLKHEQLRLASKSEPEIFVVPESLREDRAVDVSSEIAAQPDTSAEALLTNCEEGKVQ